MQAVKTNRGVISDANAASNGITSVDSTTTNLPGGVMGTEDATGVVITLRGENNYDALQFYLQGWPVNLYWRSLWNNTNDWHKMS